MLNKRSFEIFIRSIIPVFVGIILIIIFGILLIPRALKVVYSLLYEDFYAPNKAKTCKNNRYPHVLSPDLTGVEICKYCGLIVPPHMTNETRKQKNIPLKA